MVIIEESHMSVHTWPELAYAAVDFFTCGRSTPFGAHEVLREGLASDKTVIMDFVVDREESVYPMVPAGASITEMLLV